MRDDPMNSTKAPRGEALPFSKLTDDDVRLIRELVAHREELRRQAAELSNTKIAEKFGVHRRTLDAVVSGITWRHVE